MRNLWVGAKVVWLQLWKILNSKGDHIDRYNAKIIIASKCVEISLKNTVMN